MTVTRLILFGMLVAFGGIAVTIGWVKFEIQRVGPTDQSTIIEVTPGDTITKITREMFDENIIRRPVLMRIEARRRGIERSIHIGEFLIPEGASISEVLDVLEKGKVVQYPATFPEGLTTKQVLKRIREADFLTGEIEDKLVEEGTLLPSTYYFPRRTSRIEVVKRMENAQEHLLDELWPLRQRDLPIASKEEAIILASVVEKESSHVDEMPLVAGVFIERLRRGMRLESDPTTIYGISGGEPLYNASGQRRTLYRSELRAKTDWNTYQIQGLPKTPICNPGRNAIAAVLQPEATDYLFFVADGKGGHSFARTLEEHEANVVKYREYERAEIARERSD